MTRDQERHDEALEANIEKLLDRSQPEISLPQDRKERILKALQGSASVARTMPGRPVVHGSPRIARRLVGWLAAAAAVLVVFLLALWPGGGLQQGVVWADVARHLDEVTSFTTWATLEETTPSGERVVRHARIYQKDPALTRTEFLDGGDSHRPADGAVAPDSIQSITITVSEPERATILRLDPRERVAHRTLLSFEGDERESRGAMRRHMVSGAWARLKYLTSDQTRDIGWREIDGEPVIGFEAEIKEMFGKPALTPMEGWVRVWASEDEGIPLRVELEFTGPEGNSHRTTYGQLEWNVELPDGLFAVPPDGEWTILEDEVRPPLPPGKRLR